MKVKLILMLTYLLVLNECFLVIKIKYRGFFFGLSFLQFGIQLLRNFLGINTESALNCFSTNDQ